MLNTNLVNLASGSGGTKRNNNGNPHIATTRPRVLVLYTGGTIGMKQDPKSGEYIPFSGYLQEQVKNTKNFYVDSMPTFEIKEFDKLIDSSNMQPSHWVTIANSVYQYYNDYEGFVIIHGTDTLAYTASALSFMFPSSMKKHIIVTGAQIPMAEPYNDGIFNLLGAIYMAGHYTIPEVTVFFSGRLTRGNRTRKITAWGLDAFNSQTYIPLAVWGGTDILVDDKSVRNPVENVVIRTNEWEKIPPINYERVGNSVTIIHIYPGISGKDFYNMTIDKKGVILLCYGTGNGPSDNIEFITAIKNAHDKGMIIVDATQTHWGMVDLNHYEAGGAMSRAGVISAYNMTPEAAYTKLMVLLANYTDSDGNYDQKMLEHLMQTDTRGELSTPIKDTEYRFRGLAIQ